MTFKNRVKRWLYSSCPGFAGRFPYLGAQVCFPKGATIFDVVCQQGIYELEIVQRLRKLVRPGTFYFDIGANLGLMAIPVLQECPTCRVVSFEPSPSSLPFLQRTISESAYADRWCVVAKALSHQSGELDFDVGLPKDALCEGFMSAKRMMGAHKVKVPVSTLDHEWKQLGRPPVSVIKIDVEGAEGLVLACSREVLKECHPFLILEWYGDYLREFGTPPDRLVEFAHASGYAIYSIPQGVPVGNTRDLAVQMMGCSNYLLAPLTAAPGFIP